MMMPGATASIRALASMHPPIQQRLCNVYRVCAQCVGRRKMLTPLT